MRVAFLITGIPRQFSKNLKIYLDSLDTFLDYDIYLYFPKENIQENYANEIFNPETFLTILKNPRYKLILIDTNLPNIQDNLSRKQKNSIIQWYRIQKCFSFIPDEYDLVIINDNLNNTYQKISSVIEAKRLQRYSKKDLQNFINNFLDKDA